MGSSQGFPRYFLVHFPHYCWLWLVAIIWNNAFCGNEIKLNWTCWSRISVYAIKLQPHWSWTCAESLQHIVYMYLFSLNTVDCNAFLLQNTHIYRHIFPVCNFSAITYFFNLIFTFYFRFIPMNIIFFNRPNSNSNNPELNNCTLLHE